MASNERRVKDERCHGFFNVVVEGSGHGLGFFNVVVEGGCHGLCFFNVE